MVEHQAPWMIRGYLKGRAWRHGKPLDTGPNGADGLHKFDKQLVAIAAALLVLCIFLPDDHRRWIFVGMGIIVALVGWWHVSNAETIVQYARKQSMKT